MEKVEEKEVEKMPVKEAHKYQENDEIVIYGCSGGLGGKLKDEVIGKIVALEITPRKLSHRPAWVSYIVRLADGRVMKFWDGQIKRKI
jgi:hypothetical protein